LSVGPSCPFMSLCCLSFFDLRILITPLVSSNSSYGYELFMKVMIPY
jgi:hypothetical protein